MNQQPSIQGPYTLDITYNHTVNLLVINLCQLLLGLLVDCSNLHLIQLHSCFMNRQVKVSVIPIGQDGNWNSKFGVFEADRLLVFLHVR